MSLRNLIKITKVRKASNYEPKRRFNAASPAISARLWFDQGLTHGCVTTLSENELSDVPIIL